MQFPQPQYLGAKAPHLEWIESFVPEGVNVALDAFAGSQSVAYMLKKRGVATITNDFLAFCHQTGLALIENTSETLTEDEAGELFAPHPTLTGHALMRTLYEGVFFTKETAKCLDNFRIRVDELPTQGKRALALSIMCRALTRKVTMGHFAHMRALEYANDPERLKRNRSLGRPVRDIFMELLPIYNNAVFDNGRPCNSHNENIIELLPKLNGIDLAYFDPPYCGSHADYQSFYHLLETFVMQWKDKEYVNGTRRYKPKRYSGFDKKKDAVASFDRLFGLAQEIPHWLISYNNRSYPAIDDFRSLISKYKQNVRIERKPYTNSRGGKGSVAGSEEVLFICGDC